MENWKEGVWRDNFVPDTANPGSIAVQITHTHTHTHIFCSHPASIYLLIFQVRTCPKGWLRGLPILLSLAYFLPKFLSHVFHFSSLNFIYFIFYYPIIIGNTINLLQKSQKTQLSTQGNNFFSIQKSHHLEITPLKMLVDSHLAFSIFPR